MTYKLLLADDSVTIQKVVELTFSDEDFDIISVGDGVTALEKIRSERPDIVLSDVIMPGMNGYDLCTRVKQDPALKNIPFLFLKGTFESFDEDKATGVGADGFIVKPFESQELIPKVKELVEKYRSGAPAAAPAEAVPAAPVEIPEVPAPEEETISFLDESILEEVTPAEAAHPLEEAPAPAMETGFGEMEPEAPAPGLMESDEVPEEDLWSEVKISDHPIPPAVEEAPPAPEPMAAWTEIPEKAPAPPPLEELAAPGMMEAPAEEAVEPPAWEPEAIPETETPAVAFEPAPEIPVVEEPPPVAAQPTEEIQKALAGKVEEVLREMAPDIIREVARKVITEVAWEVIPETAEKLIQKEIERLTGGQL